MIVAENITEVQERITKTVQNIFPNIQVINGICTDQIFERLEKPMITVTLKKVITKSESLENYMGTVAAEVEHSQVYAQQATVEFLIRLCLPYEQTGYKDGEFFMHLCGGLLFQYPELLEEMSCKEMIFDEQLQAFVLDIWGGSTMMVTRAQPYWPIKQVTVHHKNSSKL